MHLEIFLAENQVNYDHLCCDLTKKFHSKNYIYDFISCIPY